MSRAAILLLIAAGTSACAHADRSRSEVFADPARYAGRLVQVCGYRAEPANLIDRRRFDRGVRGLSILDAGPLEPLYTGRVCVEGTIEHVGCQSGEVVCLDWAFDYGVRIRRLLR